MEKLSNMKQSELNRAKFAYDCVNDAVKVLKDKENIIFETINNSERYKLDTNNYFKTTKYYKSYVKKVPTYIQVNGLAGTFAFIFSKMTKNKENKEKGSENNPYSDWDLIYFQTWEWLNKNYKKGKEKDELMEWILELDSKLYKAVTIEVLSLFSWLRRFAEGMIEDEEKKNKGVEENQIDEKDGVEK